jgi:hypothetical protein
VRRTQALDPAAFLVDQDRRIRFTNGVSQLLNKLNNLYGRSDIPLEQNKSPRPLIADELALGGAEFQSGYACDECAAIHGAD